MKEALSQEGGIDINDCMNLRVTGTMETMVLPGTWVGASKGSKAL